MLPFTISPLRRTKRSGTARAGLLLRQRFFEGRHRRQVDATQVDELIVLGDARLVERRFPRHQSADAQRAAAGLQLHLARKRLAGGPLAHHQSGAAQQLAVVHHLAAFDELGEEIVGEPAIAGDLGQRLLQSVDGVGRAHLAGRLLTGPAELRPQRLHELVAGHLRVGPIAQRQVETQADHRAIGVVRDEQVGKGRAIDRRRGIHERRQPAHVDRAAELAARARASRR